MIANADDIHYMGGALLTNNMSWADDMLAISCSPPDPDVVGAAWREMWLRRLDEQGLWMIDWLSHQRRDAFYRHGSVCEDYSAIQCPVYVVGGWADGYSNAVFRLLRHLRVPTKGLVGPWAHKYPHFAKPGPPIGFLHECVRWWEQWLRGRDTGAMRDPKLVVWINDGMRPLSHIPVQEGSWVTEPSWPSETITTRQWSLRPGRLADAPGDETMCISSPATVGMAFGSWSPSGLGFDLATDQRVEVGGSLVFDSPALAESIELLGAPIVELTLSCDQTQGQVACVLSEVLAAGPATRVSYAVLNLSHRDSHAAPEPLTPGRCYRLHLQLNDAGHRFAVGSRLRIAISSAYWPTLWPAPTAATLTIGPDGTLSLPVRSASGARPASFLPADGAAALRQTVYRPGQEARRIETDLVSGVVSQIVELDRGEWRIDDIDLTQTNRSGTRFSILPDEPTSARHESWWQRSFSRGRWRVRTEGGMVMTCDRENFYLTAHVRAFENDTMLFSRDWNETIPRDNV